MSKQGLCRFCKKTKTLGKAHIYPRSLKSVLTTTNNFTVIRKYNGCIHKYNCQTLAFDKKILCSACDNQLGNYDKILIEFVKKYFRHSDRKKDQESRYDLSGRMHFEVDTEPLKLSILTSLLRMSFSQTVELKSVTLGDKYEAMIMQWLQEGAIQSRGEQCEIMILGSYKDVQDRDKTLIDKKPIAQKKYAHNHYYMLVLFGLIIIIKIGKYRWRDEYLTYPKLSQDLKCLDVPIVHSEIYRSTIGHFF